MSRSQSAVSPLPQRQIIETSSEYRPKSDNLVKYDPYGADKVFYNEIVLYECSCGSLRRLNSTYFCRHCMALRCRSCIAHEVDSQYCQRCLDYIPTIDPKFQMNKCALCYQCPSCQHLLSTSILSISSPVNDQQQPQDEIVKQNCQLICEFCRWSSETFVTEGSRMTSNLADIEIQNAARITELMSYFKALSQKEKTDKKKRRFHSRSGNTMDLLKKYGIDNTLSPKLFESLRARTTFHDKTTSAAKYNLEPKSSEELAIDAFKSAEPIEADQLEELDTNFHYSKDFNLEAISGIEQRLAQVESQPERVADFRPMSKSLLVKRSLRCKECERNLCRSEYSPVSIHFKIQSASYFYIPELRLRSDVYPLKLSVDEFNIVEFTLQNQTLTPVKVKLENISDDSKDLYELIIPSSELNLGPKDDTAEREHIPSEMRPLNEKTQITFQSLFKIGFYMKVKPKKKVDKLSIRFTMAHDVLLPQNPRENDRVERITHTIQVNLGAVV